MKTENNIIINTDSYKITHDRMYPKDTTAIYSYFEARNGAQFETTTFFGLQRILWDNLVGQVITQEKLTQAKDLVNKHFGRKNAFNAAKWQYIIDAYNGYLPLEIKAVPEGLKIPNSNVLMTVNVLDINCAWLTNHVETILTPVWAPSTVATKSGYIKDMLKKYLNITCDDGELSAGLLFMLHDFGMRGCTCLEQAETCGAAHLINFRGTDTLCAIKNIFDYYGAKEFPGYSIDATEHSIMTAEGREGEINVVGRLLQDFQDGPLATVADSYDIYNYVDNIIGKIYKEVILLRKFPVIVRPDSVNKELNETPESIMVYILKSLYKNFGGTINEKGYIVLHPNVRAIWGDGIDIYGIEKILEAVKLAGFSVENIAFGMGGGLLQKINRDTQRFAFKCSSRTTNKNVEIDIYKDPLDKSKASKRGKLKLIYINGSYRTVSINEPGEDIMKVVFRNGELMTNYTFDQVKENTELDMSECR